MIRRRNLIKAAAAGLFGTLAASPGRAGAELSAKAAGFRMPLESTPHLRTFMQWPAESTIYGGTENLQAVRDKIALIANAIGRFEPVVMLSRPDQMDDARPQLSAAVEQWPMAVQDLWCRDTGPTFLVNSENQLAVADFNFNGWGGKQPHDDDAHVAERVADKLGLRRFDSGVVGEGGGIEVDGAGTALAHASCWVNPNRNAGTQEQIGEALLNALGAEKMIWAPGVAAADITDYHIDALARFVKPGQVLIQLPDTVTDGDPWSAAAFETYNVLKAARDAQGNRLDIVVLPDPVRIRSRRKDFVSSYVNYFVCNGAVIAAEFGDDKADERAARTLRELYPGRTVVSLNVDAIGESGGGIHCSTQQQPKTGA